jgi:hypothetical protein
MLDVKSQEDLPQLFSMADQINSYLLKFEKGCLIITLSAPREETLTSIYKMYCGGVLAKVIKQDLLAEDHVLHVLSLAAEKFTTSVEKLEFRAENCHLNVYMSPVDYQYSLRNLRSYRGTCVIITQYSSM